MSRDQEQSSEPIADIDQLVEYFRDSARPASARGVGTEHEKMGFDAATLRPLPHEGALGIGALLEGIALRFGWERLEDGGALVALERDGAAITLEPGGQLELSGRVNRTLFETRDELLGHLHEVRAVADSLGQRWTFLALSPWFEPDDVPWMPKSRYAIMRRYLPQRGDLAEWMMKMTCTVQANLDFRDEADAMEMLRLGARLSPIVTALFANSPYWHGRAAGMVSARMEVWERTDPDRCGVPAFFLREDAGFRDYVEWALDVPMFFVRRRGAYVDRAGASFRQLLRGGDSVGRATMGDWELHLSTLFPEVRLKRYIETRSADVGDPDRIVALPALWKGVFYDDGARAAASALLGDMGWNDLSALRREARTAGLDGRYRGRVLRDLARELIGIAGAGLDAQAAGGGSERVLLEPLRDEDGTPRAPAESLCAVWERSQGDRRAVIDQFDIAGCLGDR